MCRQRSNFSPVCILWVQQPTIPQQGLIISQPFPTIISINQQWLSQFNRLEPCNKWPNRYSCYFFFLAINLNTILFHASPINWRPQWTRRFAPYRHCQAHPPPAVVPLPQIPAQALVNVYHIFRYRVN